jgi:hypothetical protein
MFKRTDKTIKTSALRFVEALSKKRRYKSIAAMTTCAHKYTYMNMYMYINMYTGDSFIIIRDYLYSFYFLRQRWVFSSIGEACTVAYVRDVYVCIFWCKCQIIFSIYLAILKGKIKPKKCSRSICLVILDLWMPVVRSVVKFLLSLLYKNRFWRQG